MVKRKIPKKAEEQIKKYIEILKEDNLPIKKVILFGSFANGTHHKWSDIDLCIVSPKFKDAWRATSYLWSKRKIFDIRYAIEPVGFSPSDFKDKLGSSLVYEIRQTGIEIPV